MKKIIQISILEKSIDALKHETGEKTGSKALLKAAQNYQSNLDTIDERNREIQELENRIEQYKGVIDRLSGVTAEIQEIIETTIIE